VNPFLKPDENIHSFDGPPIDVRPKLPTESDPLSSAIRWNLRQCCGGQVVQVGQPAIWPLSLLPLQIADLT
jgi:hypothetical protein